jgi:hypothetical protein
MNRSVLDSLLLDRVSCYGAKELEERRKDGKTERRKDGFCGGGVN